MNNVKYKLKVYSALFVLLLLGGVSFSAHADIVVVVNTANPVASLSEEDVRRIFMGRMRLFPKGEASIEAVDHDESRPIFVQFYHAITGLTPAKLKRQRASFLFSGKGRLPASLPDDAAVIDYVVTHPGGIGYLNADQVDARVKAVLTIKE
jgi:hypothetical protein